MKRLTGIIFICLTLLGGTVRAQQDDFVLENERASLRMEVPSGWNVEISENQLGQLGIMGNRLSEDTSQPRTDVQAVFRHAEDLLGVLNDPIDFSTDNPAEDYLFKYASRYAELFEGTYDLPLAFVTEDGIPGAAMLYVERTETFRLGQNVETALSLSLAFALGEDELLIVLIDGAAEDGAILLDIWADILATMRLNNEPLPFADDFLNQFEAPESLLTRYQTLQRAARPTAPAPEGLPLPGENLSVTRGDATLLFSRYEGWSVEESDTPAQITLLSEDGNARIEIALLPVPADFEDPVSAVEAYAVEQESFVIVGDVIPYDWGRLDAAIADMLTEDEDSTRVGQIIIARARSEDVLLMMRFDAEVDAPAQLPRDWNNTIIAMRWNGFDLPFERLMLALNQMLEE